MSEAGAGTQRVKRQMLGASVVSGPDETVDGKGMGRSYLAFDWRNETISMKAEMAINPAKLPLALRPMDAELAFDDIASQGIMIDVKDIINPGRDARFPVTITICTRRPPKFFIPFETTSRSSSEPSKKLRRRSTAMDFAIGGKVPHSFSALPSD